MSGEVGEGARVWLVPDGFIPEESSGSQESHEAVCVLNTSERDAHLSISVYFEDRGPIKDVSVTVPGERTRHIRTDGIKGVEIPRGVPYAVRVESDISVIVQHSRLDATQPALSLMTAIAYPVER